MGSPKDNDDDLLIKQCLAGYEPAWVDLYRRYCPLVKNVVRRQRVSPQDLEDVTQDVFAQLVSSLARYDRSYSFSGFVCMIAERVCINEYRKAKRFKRDAPTDPIDHHDGDEQGLLIVTSDADCQDEKLSEAQLLEALRQALRGLGSKCRELLRLRYYNEMPYNEIASILGASENTLTVQARRCIDQLRAIWDELMREGIGH